MFINTHPKFSPYKSYVCSTMLKKIIKSLNHSKNPFFAQITKDIQFKPNHQMYPYNETQWISNVLINKNRSNQLCEIISNHQMYPWITKDIQESFHKLKRSKTMEKLNQIKLDSINLHENIVALQWWGFILNFSWKISYALLWKINPKLKKKLN
jgi:hypothetical protein